MFAQFKIALSDIRYNRLHTFIFLIQILICFIIGGFIITEISDMNILDNKLSKIGDTNSIYYLIDDTDIQHDQEIMRKSDTKYKLYDLYRYIETSNDFEVCRFYQTTVTVNDKRLPRKFIADSFMDETAYNALYADVKYLELSKITCDKGRLFNSEDFIKTEGTIPVIAGSAYKQILNIGDIIDNRYEIIGFAEDNAFFINPSWSDEIVYLDNFLILPFTVSIHSDPLDIYQAISRSLIISNSIESVGKISEYSLALDLYTFNIRSYADQVKRIKIELYDILMIVSIFLFIVFIVCTVCMHTMLLIFINNHIREFTIHLMCGCSSIGIICRICLQVWIPMAVSFFITLVLYHNIIVALILLVFFVALSVFIIFSPLIKIRKKGLISVVTKAE